MHCISTCIVQYLCEDHCRAVHCSELVESWWWCSSGTTQTDSAAAHLSTAQPMKALNLSGFSQHDVMFTSS